MVEQNGIELEIGEEKAVEKTATFTSSDPSQDYYVQIRGKKYPIAKINGIIKITKTEITTGTNASGIITNVYSDHENYATVEKVSETTDKIKIIGVAKGEATITVEYTENIKTSFIVKVKGNVDVSTRVENISDNENVGTATAILNVPYAEGSTISLTATVTNDNYQFVGWYETKDGGTEMQKSTNLSYSYAVTDDGTAVVLLKAKFQKKPEPLLGYYIKKGNEYAIVFADRLAQAGTTVTWSEKNSSSCTFPELTDAEKAKFKTYRINGTYTDPKTIQDSSKGFGTHEVIEVVDSTGEDRFMALALSDLATDGNTYTCYNAAAGNMLDFSNTGGTDGKGSPTSKGFLKGKINTETMITKWNDESYGEQDSNSSCKDVWGQIQSKTVEGWFIPSFEEWSAFGWALIDGKFGSYRKYYSTVGVSDGYWSSSQAGKKYVWLAQFSFNNEDLILCSVNLDRKVRLATTY